MKIGYSYFKRFLLIFVVISIVLGCDNSPGELDLFIVPNKGFFDGKITGNINAWDWKEATKSPNTSRTVYSNNFQCDTSFVISIGRFRPGTFWDPEISLYISASQLNRRDTITKFYNHEGYYSEVNSNYCSLWPKARFVRADHGSPFSNYTLKDTVSNYLIIDKYIQDSIISGRFHLSFIENNKKFSDVDDYLTIDGKRFIAEFYKD